MDSDAELRLENILGSVAVALSDAVQAAAIEASGHASAGPAALTALRIHRGCSVDHLAGVLGLTHSGTVRLVDRLEEDGLVRRGQGQDARVVTLELTTKGARRASRVAAARAEAVEGFLGDLDSDERRMMLRLVEKMVVSGMVDWRQVQHRCRLCDLEACHAGGESCPLDAHMTAVSA
jgi:DNA-binding MarR family transcriptional regulator